MENPSFYDVFEEMWKCVLRKLNNYVQNSTLDEHVQNQKNPHVVTAEQAGAMPIAGGAMEGAITLNGIVLTEGVDYGDGEPEDVVGNVEPGQLYFKRVT